MTEQPANIVSAEAAPTLAPHRAYTSPRLVVHGTVQALTQGTTSIDGTSGVDDA